MTAEAQEQSFDTHLDIALDDEDQESIPRDPVYVDVVAKQSPDERRPIIPAGFHGVENIKATLRYWGGRMAYEAGYHSWRTVLFYIPLMLFWAPIGVIRIVVRLVRWWWHAELSALEQEAASKGDLDRGPRIAEQAREARRARGLMLLGGLIALLIGLVLLLLLAPRWAHLLVVATGLPWLAHVGRPRTMPIVSQAVVTHRFRRINPDIVLRAYYVAGLGHPDKPNQQILFPGRMTRDAKETGSMVPIDLPYGKTFKDAQDKKAEIASGLDVSNNQVFLKKDPSSERRHELFVADQDPLAIPAGRTDMLDGKPRNFWKPMRIGKDERDRRVLLSLLWNSILIGAQPRKGKTFFVRLILLYAALDPWVKILFADGKKSPDYDKFRMVAHRMVIGDAPNPRDSDPIEHFIEMLNEILDHIARVNDVLSELPVEMCPEGKLTEALARDPRFPDLRVWVVALEEFQVYFETEDQDTNKLIARKLQRIMAQGPSAGVTLLSSSQKPAGVGAGEELKRLFNRFRDNHQVRFALKCGNSDVSKAVLGGDALGEGYDASQLPIGDGTNGTKDYRGIGILYGATDQTPTVRTHLADHTDVEKILIKARKLREQYGTLSGLAAGDESHREYRDVMADARSVFVPSEIKMSWPELAQRLARELPEHYADITPDAISAQLTALGVESARVRDANHFDSGVGRGLKLDSLDAAIAKRALTNGS